MFEAVEHSNTEFVSDLYQVAIIEVRSQTGDNKIYEKTKIQIIRVQMQLGIIHKRELLARLIGQIAHCLRPLGRVWAI